VDKLLYCKNNTLRMAIEKIFILEDEKPMAWALELEITHAGLGRW
jgi:hypothetical protein